MLDSHRAFYVTNVLNGHVSANQGGGRPSGVVAENKGDQGEEEKWTIEVGSEPNAIALRNPANGQYLHANGGGCWATVGTGQKQRWKILRDDVTAPGACRLSPVPYPNAYLNHFEGRQVARRAVGMKVHMWTWLICGQNEEIDVKSAEIGSEALRALHSMIPVTDKTYECETA